MRNRNLYRDLQVSTEPKLITPRFAVNCWNPDGSLLRIDYVVAMPFFSKDGSSSLKDLILLQEELLRYAVFKTAAIGSLICDPEGFGLIEKIAKMLVVVGRSERGIDLNNLLVAGDYLQIGKIFLSENYSNENIIPADFQPGLVAKLHKMDFMGKLIEYNNQKQNQTIKELIKQEPESVRPAVEEIPLKPELINTPPPVAAPAKSI